MHITVCSVLLVVLYVSKGLVGGWVPCCQRIATQSMLIGANSTHTMMQSLHCTAVHAPINPVTGIFCIVLNSLDSSYSC
jgi:hypothetical protein